MTEGTRDHLFAATHLVLGPSNFLILQLPERWEVRIGRNPSEVDFSTSVGNVRWAAEGRATGFVLDPVVRRAVEVEIRTARAPVRSRAMAVARRGTCRVGGHTAVLTQGEVPIGLMRREREYAVSVVFRCEETRRHVELRLSSRSGFDAIDSLVPFLENAKCH